VKADVIFEYLPHECIDSAADGGEKHEDVGAVAVLGKRAFDSVDLAANALDAVEEFGSLP
jgi:hypothetical protein